MGGKRKNIIICADGTGNKGGYTPDSNVYKIYKAIEKDLNSSATQCDVSEQIIFYENGVGTSQRQLIQALSGGFGFGFGKNVCELYKFLARNYEPGDRVYLFGFSRGASTIRAFNGFIHACGLVDGSARRLSDRDLDVRVEEAFNAYRWEGIKRKWWHRLSKWLWRKKGSRSAEELKFSADCHGVIEIHFTGVWDTVVALGFPTRTEIISPVSAILQIIFTLFGRISSWFSPHMFYNYELTENQRYAFQALAIDDERTAFWPVLWDENASPNTAVEQVWFAGMHSNVGGGYNRSGLASVPLYWMMGKAQASGLIFEEGGLKKARNDSHVHGCMYDSRGGAATFYRYHPRDVEALCQGDGKSLLKAGRAKFHYSVIERLRHRTANYAPLLMPNKFEIVKDEIQDDLSLNTTSQEVDLAAHHRCKSINNKIKRYVKLRKFLYDFMLFLTLFVLNIAYIYWTAPEPIARSGFMGDVADVLDYFLPSFFTGIIEIAVIQNPLWLFGWMAVLVIYIWVRSFARSATTEACQDKRRLVVMACENKWSDIPVSMAVIKQGEPVRPVQATLSTNLNSNGVNEDGYYYVSQSSKR